MSNPGIASNSQLLIRAEHNRKVQHELNYLTPSIEQAPVLGVHTMELERNLERPARRATLTVRGISVPLEAHEWNFEPADGTLASMADKF